MSLSIFKVSPVKILYCSFIIFFISSLFSNNQSAAFLYVANVLMVFIFIIFLLSKPGSIVLPKDIFYLALIFLTLGLVAVQPISKSHIYSVLIFFKIMIVCLFFYQNKIGEKSFINFVNTTYVFYLMISILFWLGLLPNPNLNAFLIKDEFLVSVGSWSYYVLPGIEGSPANIDSYSAMVLLLNIFVKVSQKSRKFVIFCAIAAILLSLRLTAIMGVILLLTLAPLLRIKHWFALFNITAFMAFLLLLYALHIDFIFNLFNIHIDISTIAYLATHARSVIWEQQVFILFSEYDWNHYIFGGFNVELFNVPTFQITGTETGKSQSNPHNTYLLLFFRSPLFMMTLLSLLLINMVTTMDKKYYIPISFILLACYTNSAIISLENPIFLYVLIFSLLGIKTKAKINNL